MENKRNFLKNQQGFTLVEIIAVLVILGILAAVAVPKFVDMQEEAKEKAVEGALAAGISNATMTYSKFLLKYGASPAQINTTPAWSDGTNTVDIETNLGDFTASYGYKAGTVTVTLTAGTPSWFSTYSGAKSKAFPIGQAS